MIEAVENHMPEIIIIDEIGTELEAAAARTIAERGVQLVGTAHGNALENLIKNPTITDLIGGIQYVTLGDEEAKRRSSSKSILERKAPPTFEVAVEIHDAKTWVIHENIEQSVDLLLQGQTVPLQQRKLISEENNIVQCEIITNQKESKISPDISYRRTNVEKRQKNNYLLNKINKNDGWKSKNTPNSDFRLKKKLGNDFIFVYIYGVNNQDIKSLIKTLRLPIVITKEIQSADAILALSNLIKNNKKLRQISHSKKISIHTIQSNSLLQIAKALRILVNSIFPLKQSTEIKSSNKKISHIISKELLTPLEETRLVIEELIIPKKLTIELLPRVNSIRKLQHELISHYQLTGISVGSEANRRIRIYPK
jgi:hypothetical protein